LLGFPVYLVFGESNDLESPPAQSQIARPILHEGDPTTVVLVAIGFHNQLPVSPKD
jgi:hypothetical protein